MLSKRVLERVGAALGGREPLADRFVDLDAVPFHQMLTDRWEIIRRDLARYVQIVSLTDVRDMVSIEDYAWDGASGWKKEALYVAGEVNQLFAQLCPASAAIIERLAQEYDTAQYVGISVLAPSSRIAPHKDYNPAAGIICRSFVKREKVPSRLAASGAFFARVRAWRSTFIMSMRRRTSPTPRG
jgi:hypothetical protein